MDPKIVEWLLAGHVISLFLWVGGLFAIYWMLRLHAHAPTDTHEKLTLMERSIALSADIAATVAIATGLVMALSHNRMHPTTTLFAAKGAGWFHIKLAVVVLGVLPVHGILRGKIKKFGMGKIAPVPQWLWSLFLASITVIVILVFRGWTIFAK